ncbi:MAG: bifunctional demethylmenaquinone methyltransferase/2-methoxy-6-polyprenyl-1,4-benzoquinol methylase UbiE [Bacteroidales bacterium]|jgi:demethylmenaquinone methyltransferase/2-methoxy-6-polyprenyl-1,4-benzoquinol methylase
MVKKKERPDVGSMFDSIAWRYDFLNHFLSFGIDRSWRREAMAMLSDRYKDPVILDVATGTGDMAVESMNLNPGMVIGVDISEKMIELAGKKVFKKGLGGKIRFDLCDSANLDFTDNSFDIVMSGFGVRNFSDLRKGLSEMHRVTRKGGSVLILEFSKPTIFPFKQVYDFYFRQVLPGTGRFFSGDREAYSYLYNSVMEFPDGELFINILKATGYSEIQEKRLTLGVSTIYTGVKN